MLNMLLSRLATAIPSIVGVVVVTFMLTRLLPGDPAAYFAGLAASPQAIAEVRTKLGLDKSLPEQFVAYVGDLLQGAPAPTGRLDAFLSPPTHITGFYLIDSALTGNLETFRGALSQLALPAISMAIFSLAPLARMTRGSMLAVLGSDFIRTARASGLSPRTVIFTYAFRNAVLPVITTLGMVFSFLLGANVLVETVFAWPGIGLYAVNALITSDYAPVQGFVFTMAILYVALNLTIDFLYGLVDPRVRLDS